MKTKAVTLSALLMASKHSTHSPSPKVTQKNTRLAKHSTFELSVILILKNYMEIVGWEQLCKIWKASFWDNILGFLHYTKENKYLLSIKTISKTSKYTTGHQ